MQNNKKLLWTGKYGKSFEYTSKGIVYKCYGDANSCLIFDSTKYNLGDMKEKAEKTKIFKGDNEFTLGMKKIDFPDLCVRYIDCNMRPEDFCPAFFSLTEPVTYGFLIRIDIDYNKLFDIMDRCFREDKSIFTTGDLFYWDTIDRFFDFLFVYILTSPALKDDSETRLVLMSYFNVYNTYKKLINIWKQNQLLLQRICYDFYRSFSGKINIDRVKSLEDKLTRFFRVRNGLVADDSYEELLEVFTKCPFCSGMIANQFGEQCFQLPLLIRQAIEDLNNNRSDGLVDEFRNIGYIIYSLGFTIDDEGEQTCFPFAVSKAAFLGDVGKGINQTPVVNNLIRIQNAQSNAKDIEGRIVDLAAGALENLDGDKLLLITNYITAKNNDENLGLTEEDIEQIAEQAFRGMTKKQSADLSQKVIRARIAKKNLDTIVYNDIGEYANTPIYEIVDLNKQNEADNKIAQLQNEKELSKVVKKIKTNEKMDEENFSSIGQTVYRGPDSRIVTNQDEIIKYWEELVKKVAENNLNLNSFKYAADIVRYSNQFPNATVADMFTYTSNNGTEKFVDTYVKRVPKEAVPYIASDYRMPLLTDVKSVQEYRSEDLKPFGIKYTSNYIADRKKKDGDESLKNIKITKGNEDTTNYGTQWPNIGSGKKEKGGYYTRNYSSTKRKINYGDSGTKYSKRGGSNIANISTNVES